MQETVSDEAVPAEEQKSSIGAVLRNRNFRLLWFGEGISLLGDQFYMIALPWLVLQLTGDGLAMGTVLAVAGIPRALFMLIGGALTDRFSSRSVMLASNLARMVLTGLLAVVTLAGVVELWMIYALALTFGLADAFFFPASSAIVPQIVDRRDLQSGNAVIQGTAQLSIFIGPMVAGLLIALLSGGQTAVNDGTVPDIRGIGLAFAFDTLTFLVSVVALVLMRVRPARSEESSNDGNMLKAIRDGILTVWRDGTLRNFFVVVVSVNFLVVGPIEVGIPYLADTRFIEGAVAFGVIMSAFGGGMLLGTVLAGVLPRPRPAQFGPLLLSVGSGLGIGLALLGLANTTVFAALVALLMGLVNGYINIYLVTWLQTRTPDALLGRIMSLLMFASVGLVPISNALTGALVEIHATGLFVTAGAIMVVVMLGSLLNPAIRTMGVEPVTEA
jgi:MFS family permease